MNRVRYLFVTLIILTLAGFNLSSAINIEGQELRQAYHPNNLIRLRIQAHSNLLQEQELKVLVRDRLLEETQSLFLEVNSKEKAQEILKTNLHKFRDLVKEVLQERGLNHQSEVKYQQVLFPGQEYGEIFLPPGFYPSLQVKIGDGKGDNWWCVLFPPLCFIDALEEIHDSLEDKETLEFRFRLQNSYPTVKEYLVRAYLWVLGKDLLGHRARAIMKE